MVNTYHCYINRFGMGTRRLRGHYIYVVVRGVCVAHVARVRGMHSTCAWHAWHMCMAHVHGTRVHGSQGACARGAWCACMHGVCLL